MTIDGRDPIGRAHPLDALVGVEPVPDKRAVVGGCGSPRCPRSQDDEVARLRAENAKLEAGTLASARTRDEARQALRGVELELAHTRRERDEAREQLLDHVRAAAEEGERLDARVAALEAENAALREPPACALCGDDPPLCRAHDAEVNYPLDGLVEHIKKLRTHREFAHCGATHRVSYFAIYNKCPTCGTNERKCHCLGGPSEVWDVLCAARWWLIAADVVVPVDEAATLRKRVAELESQRDTLRTSVARLVRAARGLRDPAVLESVRPETVVADLARRGWERLPDYGAATRWQPGERAAVPRERLPQRAVVVLPDPTYGDYAARTREAVTAVATAHGEGDAEVLAAWLPEDCEGAG